MKSAVFKTIKGKIYILCSECNIEIKSELDFNILEKYALDGIIILSPQFCKEHVHLDILNRNNYDKKKD